MATLIFQGISQLFARLKARISTSDLWLGVALASIFLNVLGLIFPLVLLQIYDRVIPNAATSTLSVLVSLVIVVVVFELILKIARSAIIHWADSRFEYKMGTALFQHILRADLYEYLREGAGSYLERMNALSQTRDFHVGQALIACIDTPFILIYLAIIAYLGQWLVLVPIISLSLFGVMIMSRRKVLQHIILSKRQADDRRLNFLIELFSGIHTIKSQAMEALMLRRYERLQENNAIFDYETAIFNGETDSIRHHSLQLTLIFIVGLGSVQVLMNNMTIGGLAACTFLASRVLQPINRLIGVWSRLQNVKVAQQRAMEIFDLSEESHVTMPPGAVFRGDVSLKNVAFSYPDAATNVMENVSLHVPAGEFIGITGKSMSGKSTLLQLIAGTLVPTAGTIVIDDSDMQCIDRDYLRRHVAYIPQESAMFAGSIMDNLTMFRGPSYHQAAKDIAQQLGLIPLIQRLPQGFNTPIGDKAVDILPRGVKQRITIARALIDNPKIVLFDEANTAVDVVADNKIREYFLAKRGRLTLILVSHRPSLLSITSRQFELLDGQLIMVTS